MEDFIKYGRARDQLYHLKVKFRQLDESISKKRRTPELISALEMVGALIDTICEAHAHLQVVAMQLDVYDVVGLPGFDDLFNETENPQENPED